MSHRISKPYKYHVRSSSKIIIFSIILLKRRIMLSGFELFVDVMKNVLKDIQVEASNMARYFWRHFALSFRQCCMWVTSQPSRLSSDEAMNLLTKMFELHYLPPFSLSFFQDIWENTTEEFKTAWVTTKDEEIDKLVVLFANQCAKMIAPKYTTLKKGPETKRAPCQKGPCY